MRNNCGFESNDWAALTLSGGNFLRILNHLRTLHQPIVLWLNKLGQDRTVNPRNLAALSNSIFANLATDSLKLTNSDRAPARHLFWHSVVTSESLGNIGQSRGQTFDDASTHELVRNFLIEKGESITVQKVFGGEGIPQGDYSQVDWRAYEDSARALFFRDVQEKPGELIRLMLIEKPLLWLQSFSWFVGVHLGDSRSTLEQQLGFPAPSNHLRLIRTFVLLAFFGVLLGLLILKTSQEILKVSIT